MKLVILVWFLLTFAIPVQAKSYLLFNFHLAENVPVPTWLGIHQLKRRPHKEVNEIILGNTFRHYRIAQPLDLVRIRAGRIQLVHLDFGKRHVDETYPVREFAPDTYANIRSNTVHFLGDTFVSSDASDPIHQSRPESLAEVCRRFDQALDGLRFIVLRPFEDSDLEITSPCDPMVIEMTPIR